MKIKSAVFIFNLIQDVNILRPIILFSAKKLGWPVTILITDKFHKKDKDKIWLSELNEIYHHTGATVCSPSLLLDVLSLLNNKQGLLFSASESSLKAHRNTYEIFRVTPSSFLKVTVQHGYECPGFLNSKEHDAEYGRVIDFNADLLCTWQPATHLKTLLSKYSSKVYQSGPSFLLHDYAFSATYPKDKGGLICENLHSVRVSASSGFVNEFVEMVDKLCEKYSSSHTIYLRPHPSGLFSKKNSSIFSGQYELLTKPIYKIKLSNILYAISPPSSIIFELMCANVPVAVFVDKKNNIDLHNYQGLTVVQSYHDAVCFINKAIADPAWFINSQNRFLSSKGFEVNPEKITKNYQRLFDSVTHQNIFSNPIATRKTILFVVSDSSPTLNIHFLQPLYSNELKKIYDFEILNDNEINKLCKHELLNDKLINISPSIVVFVRLVEKNSLKVLKWAKYYSVPTVHFIDDDLLRFPKSLGIEKYNYYTCSDRVKVFKRLLTETTLVYCSTKRLKESLEKNDIVATFEVAKIYCSGEVLCSPKTSEVITIGYMGTNHQNDFKLIIRPLVELLKRNKNVKFEIMGKTPMPKELLEFSSQIKVIPWVQSYSQFRETLVSLDWDIGLCPLEKNTFNLAKADTKWVEYSSCGIAVIASSGTVYDASADGNCALLADSSDEWLQALESLVFDSNTRKTLVRNAQKKLLNHYSITMLGEQLLHVFKKVQILNQRNVSEMIDG